MKSKKIGLFFNTEKILAIEIALRLLEWGKQKEITFLCLDHEAKALGINGIEFSEWISTVSFAVVIGGDGTFLRAARTTMPHPIPLYGVNVGNLGFLVPGRPDSAEKDIFSIINGKGHLLNRSPLVACLKSSDGDIVYRALNECVVCKGVASRPIEFDVQVNAEPLCVFLADGLIVSTPTGSTAYALSAGGPIVPPHVECLLLVPICAHALYAKPFVLGPKDRISVCVRGLDSQTKFIFDGQEGAFVEPDSTIDFMLDPSHPIPTIDFQEHSYYGLLQEKLNWGVCGNRTRRGPQ